MIDHLVNIGKIGSLHEPEIRTCIPFYTIYKNNLQMNQRTKSEKSNYEDNKSKLRRISLRPHLGEFLNKPPKASIVR